MKKSGSTTYQTSGVDYKKIDPLKKLAQFSAKRTSKNSPVAVIEQSRGESAFVWEEETCFRAFVIEGLGTKNLIADQMRKITGKTYYDLSAQDTVAMIVNDLIVVGAKPQIINAYFAAGSSQWFTDKKRVKDLVSGWTKACKLAGAVWGGGESPVLSGIINSDTVDLAGSAIGIIKPKERLTLGDKIKEGDSIILVESSGIHANGLSLVRKIIENLKDGIKTKMENGNYFGQDLLKPTLIYSRLVGELFDQKVNIHYMVNITGHGWRKLMRANRQFSYIIEYIPPPPPIFHFIQRKGNLSDFEMYQTFNMGAGFAIILPQNQVSRAEKIIANLGFKSWHAGVVQEGKRQVIIKQKNIKFSGETLSIR